MKKDSRFTSHATSSLGFTLIELLVVISIISFFSSIVYSTIGTSRQKANIAAGQQFGGQISRVLSDTALISYDFNEASGDVIDYSGNGYNGLISTNGGTASRDTTDVPIKNGASMRLSGGGFIATNAPGAYFTPVTIGDYTVSVWVEPVNISGTPYIVDSGRETDASTPNRKILLWLSADGALHPGWRTNSGYCWFNSPTSLTPLNAWTHIAYTFNSATNGIKLFVNGKEVPSSSITNNGGCTTPVATVDKVFLGRHYSNTGGYFDGRLDNFAIYKTLLALEDIHAIYAQGLPEHKVAVK